MKEAKYNRGTIKLNSETGEHSIVLTKAWQTIAGQLLNVANNTPGVDTRNKATRGRPPKEASPEVTHEKVSESVSAEASA